MADAQDRFSNPCTAQQVRASEMGRYQTQGRSGDQQERATPSGAHPVGVHLAGILAGEARGQKAEVRGQTFVLEENVIERGGFFDF